MTFQGNEYKTGESVKIGDEEGAIKNILYNETTKQYRVEIDNVDEPIEVNPLTRVEPMVSIHHLFVTAILFS